MKISDAFRRAFRVYFRYPAASVKFLVTELCLTLICLAPLLFLTNPALRWGAVLAPVLCLLLLPAIRLNAAAAMQDGLENGSLFSLRLADSSGFGRKMAYGFSRCLLLLLWAAPLIAGLIVAWVHFAGEIDGLTVLRMIYSFGGNDMKTGVFYLLLIFSVLLLIFFFGVAFHSGDRHARVLGCSLKRHRGGIVLCWICALLMLLPLLIAIGIVIARYAPLLNDLNGVVSGTAEKPSTRESLIILAVGTALNLPLLPVRSLIIGAYVNGLKD